MVRLGPFRIARFLSRNWLLLAAIPAALALGAAQAAWFRVTKPALEEAAAVAVASIVVLGLFLALLLGAYESLRKPVRDLRYRWLTRDIDRQMKVTRKSPFAVRRSRAPRATGALKRRSGLIASIALSCIAAVVGIAVARRC